MYPLENQKTYRIIGLAVFLTCLLIPNLALPQNIATRNSSGSFGTIQFQSSFELTRLTSHLSNHTTEISGNFAISGAPNDDMDEADSSYKFHAGAAYIYEIDQNQNWVKKQKLVASDRTANDLFGWTVAISGNYAAISAPQKKLEKSSPNSSSGAVYIFFRNKNGKWVEKQKIIASEQDENLKFGNSISISSDHLIIGSNGAALGSAHLYDKGQMGFWTFSQKITAEDHTCDRGFGYLVSTFDNYSIIGSRDPQLLKQNSENGKDQNTHEFSTADAVYIYEKNKLGAWQLRQTINEPKLTFLCLEKLF